MQPNIVRVSGAIASPLAFVLLLGTADGIAGSSEGWLTWGGPTRNFVVQAPKLAERWPSEGPARLWARELGEGYSGIAVTKEALFTMYRREAAFWQLFTEDEEVVAALDPKSGETLWEYSYEAPFESEYHEAGPGPHAMPQVVGDLVYSVGATGKLHALERRGGELVWQRDLYEEFGGTRLPFGYSSHPLPYGDNLIVLVGGTRKAVVALNLKTGEEAWSGLSFENAHTAPLLISVDGQEQIVAFTADKLQGIDPENGRLLWNVGHDVQYGLAVSTPVWHPEKQLLFFSAAYDFGGKVLRLHQSDGRTEVEEVWHDNRMKVHFGSVVRVGSTLYLSRGHNGPALMSAVEFETGKTLWHTREFAKASFLWADEKLIIVDEDGHLALATVAATGPEVHSKIELLTPNAWTVPSLVGATLYVRDRHVIMALDVGAP